VLTGIGGPPARGGDTLYFGSLGGEVHALVARTGQLRWKVHPGWAVRSPPVVTPTGLWVSDGSGYLHDLSRINGDRRGRGMRSWYDRDISAPTPGDRGLYLATRSAVLSLRTNGSVRWRYALGRTSPPPPHVALPAPVLAGDVLYLNHRRGRLLALDAETGALLWQRRATRGAFTAPAPAREGLFVGSSDGRVTLLSAPGGDH
jgi:outer membrane protein assembly factor BamB